MKTLIMAFLGLITFAIAFPLSAFSDGTSLTPEGIKFPDGSVQTTKATETGIPGPQGPAGPGCLSVYSNDGQYLGSLVDAGTTSSEIFNPSLGKFFVIVSSVDTPGYGDIFVYTEFFATTDCTGTSYLSVGRPILNSYIVKKHDGSYVTSGTLRDVTIKSYMMPPSSDCTTGSYTSPCLYDQIPISTMPFTLPVKLPLVIK